MFCKSTCYLPVGVLKLKEMDPRLLRLNLKQVCTMSSCYLTSILLSVVAELPKCAGLPIYNLASPCWLKLCCGNQLAIEAFRNVHRLDVVDLLMISELCQ